MFTREGILDPLACAIFAVSQDATIVDDTAKRSLDVLLLFCQVAQSDEHVRQGFASRNIMMRQFESFDGTDMQVCSAPSMFSLTQAWSLPSKLSNTSRRIQSSSKFCKIRMPWRFWSTSSGKHSRGHTARKSALRSSRQFTPCVACPSQGRRKLLRRTSSRCSSTRS